MTTDVDVVVRGDSVEVPRLLRILAQHAVEPRIEDAAAFAEKNLVLLLRHTPSGVDVDLSLGWTDFEREAIASSTPAAYGRASYPVARAEDLVVFKALAARPKDIEDAAALMLMHAIDLRRVRRRVAELAALADEPALFDGLERLIAHVRSVRRSSSKRRSVIRAPAQPRKQPRKRSRRKSRPRRR